MLLTSLKRTRARKSTSHINFILYMQGAVPGKRNWAALTVAIKCLSFKKIDFSTVVGVAVGKLGATVPV